MTVLGRRVTCGVDQARSPVTDLYALRVSEATRSHVSLSRTRSRRAVVDGAASAASPERRIDDALAGSQYQASSQRYSRAWPREVLTTRHPHRAASSET